MYSTTQLLFLQSSPVVFLLIGLLHSPQFADKNPVFVGELSHTCGLNYPPDTLGFQWIHWAAKRTSSTSEMAGYLACGWEHLCAGLHSDLGPTKVLRIHDRVT
jgi:hypothetical protein